MEKDFAFFISVLLQIISLSCIVIGAYYVVTSGQELTKATKPLKKEKKLMALILPVLFLVPSMFDEIGKVHRSKALIRMLYITGLALAACISIILREELLQ